MAVAVGIIGAGTSATIFHAPFVSSHPSFRLQKFLRTAEKPVAGYETVPVTDSIASFLPGIDLAVVTTPTHTHFELAKACLEAGKHVILEKPMAVSHQQCLQLCELAGRQDRLLAVYQNRRWDGDFQLVQQLLACGALGRVVEYESHFDRFRNSVKPGWKEQDLPGSGVLYDLGAHLLDQALTLFGPPSSLTAHVLNQRQLPGSNAADAFTITLHYQRPRSQQANTPDAADAATALPLTAILRASMLARKPGPRFLLHGDLGSFEKAGLDVQEAQLRAGLAPTDPGFGVEGPEGYGTLDSIALHMPPPPPPAASTRPRSAGSARPPSPAAAPGPSSSSSSSSSTVAVDISWVQAGMLAHVAKGGSAAPSSSGAVVRVATPRSCWMAFYDEIASILLGDAAVAVAGPAGGGSAAQQLQQHKGPAVQASPAGPDAYEGAPAAAAAGESGGSGGLNSRLSVPPEQAAAVIRLIEVALRSSEEGHTIQL